MEIQEKDSLVSNNSGLTVPTFAYVSENAKSLLRRVMLHPNFINGISIEEDIETLYVDPCRE